jgi:hypothetical protein
MYNCQQDTNAGRQASDVLAIALIMFTARDCHPSDQMLGQWRLVLLSSCLFTPCLGKSIRPECRTAEKVLSKTTAGNWRHKSRPTSLSPAGPVPGVPACICRVDLTFPLHCYRSTRAPICYHSNYNIWFSVHSLLIYGRLALLQYTNNNLFPLQLNFTLISFLVTFITVWVAGICFGLCSLLQWTSAF